jgi:1-acyl-sn-glycerol-3-phosphate acyltransferase
MIKITKSPFRGEHSFWSALAQKFNYLQRLFGTAFGFALFGGGGFLLCLTVFPFVMLVSRDHVQRIRRVRLIIRYLFKAFLNILEFLGVLEIKTQHLESIQDLKGCLIICNHPSLLDVVIIMSRVKNIQCVVKNEIWKNPFIGGIVRAAGYIRNDIDPEIFLKESQTQLKQGENIIIFPEGTRTTPGKPMELRRGLGNLALAASTDIQALIIQCDPITLTKGEKWYRIPPKKIIFQLQAGRYFPIENYQTDAPRSIRVRALMRDIQHYYNRNLGYE